MIAYPRAILRVVLLLLITFVVGGLQTLLAWLPRPYFYILPNLWGRLAIWAFGIKLVMRGTPCEDRPTIYVANHSSYLDIITLSAALKACFISKASVEKWPIAGWLAQIQGTVFINRKREEAKKQTDILADRLRERENLILFAEGTTSDGNRLLPLKSSLLGVAQYARAVQPITIGFTALDGIPVGRTFRYLYAWIGDESMPPHFKRLLLQNELEVTITFHPPIRDGLADRKGLAQRLEATMRDGVNSMLHRMGT